MMEGYCPQRVPFLTVIFLSDKKVDFLLSSRHDPISIGLDEHDVSTIKTDTCRSPGRRKAQNKKYIDTAEGLEIIMKNVIKLCKTNKDESQNNKQKPTTNGDELLLKNRPLTELFELIEQHQKHLKLLKHNNMLTDEKKTSYNNRDRRYFCDREQQDNSK